MRKQFFNTKSKKKTFVAACRSNDSFIYTDDNRSARNGLVSACQSDDCSRIGDVCVLQARSFSFWLYDRKYTQICVK